MYCRVYAHVLTQLVIRELSQQNVSIRDHFKCILLMLYTVDKYYNWIATNAFQVKLKLKKEGFAAKDSIVL